MCTLYRKGVLPSAARLFPNNNNWLLQEDNDPKHRSKIAKEWKGLNNVWELQWPSMSPDLNPIENVWNILKMKITKKNIRKL
jgi:hypothetical protein